MCLENKHEKFLTYLDFAPLFYPLSREKSPGGKMPARHGRPLSKTRICVNLEIKWTSLIPTLYALRS